jgi:hypothetical protein
MRAAVVHASTRQETSSPLTVHANRCPGRVQNLEKLKS